MSIQSQHNCQMLVVFCHIGQHPQHLIVFMIYFVFDNIPKLRIIEYGQFNNCGELIVAPISVYIM